MSRDDQRGGWLPIAGGGMSNIALYKLPVATGVNKVSRISSTTAPTTGHSASAGGGGVEANCGGGGGGVTTTTGATTGATGGGQAAVVSSTDQYEYVIVGQRIHDQQVFTGRRLIREKVTIKGQLRRQL